MDTNDDRLQHGRGYPRPQLRREKCTSLDGAWQFAVDENAVWSRPDEVVWDRTIRVPETQASGIAQMGFFRPCWYRRRFARPDIPDGHRVLLHFGAVDYEACGLPRSAPARRVLSALPDAWASEMLAGSELGAAFSPPTLIRMRKPPNFAPST